MGINGHTRLDLYSSCTAVQVTLKNSHIAIYSYSPLTKTEISVNILPRTVQTLPFGPKWHLSRWESMNIPDLTCTVLVRPYRSPWRISHSYIQDFPLTKTQISVNILPRTVQTSRLDQNVAPPDENQWTYQTWPVQFLYGRTGDLEEFT